jgi:hypothetical protein
MSLILAVVLAASLAGAVPAAVAVMRCDPVQASPLPGKPCGERFGVNAAHLKIKDSDLVDRELEAMHEAGIGWVRFDFDWIYVEPSQGNWDFSMYDHAVEEARSYGIRILGIIGSCPPWANGGQDWNYPPVDMAAWRDYVQRVVSRYQGTVAAWEVWNEENIHAFWQPAPDAAAYVELLRNASQVIRGADPAAKIVMGGVAGLGSDYLDASLRAGAAEYIDAIAIHPYPETLYFGNYSPQEANCRYIVNWLRTWLLPQYTTKQLELWITEVGWTTSTLSPPGVSEENQADYMLRTLINYASMDGVDKIFYYDMWDESGWAWDPMSNYGLLHYDFSPRLSYRFYRTLEAVLGEAVPTVDDFFTTSCGRPGSLEAHSFLLTDGRIALAVWKTDAEADSLSFTLLDTGFDNGAAIDLSTGEPSPVPGLARDGEGRLTASGLAVGKTPVILVFTPDTPNEEPPPPEEPPVVEEPPPGGENPVDEEPAPPQPPSGQEPDDPPQPPAAQDPACTEWYFAEGCTAGGFETWILVQNPGDEAVDATLTFMTGSGEVAGPAATLPPRSRCTYNAGEYVRDYDVSTRVDATGSVVCERAMYWEKRKGGHDSLGATSPSTTWYLAEGCTAGGFETWILVQNPGDEAVDATLTFMTGSGEVAGPAATLPPRSRRTFNAGEYVTGYDVSTRITATGDVVCERSMYAPGRREGSNSPGITCPSRNWYLAEGCTAGGFETWILIQNPGDEAVDVTLTFMAGSGEVAGPSATLPAHSRHSFNAGEYVYEYDVSTRVEATGNVACERSMYWDNRAGMHGSVGVSSPSTTWYLAEGCTAGGFETWIMVQNPGDEAVDVTLNFMTGSGEVAGPAATLPPRSRRTFNAGEYVADYEVSTRVSASGGVVCERSMYWGRGSIGTAGHNSIGSPY